MNRRPGVAGDAGNGANPFAAAFQDPATQPYLFANATDSLSKLAESWTRRGYPPAALVGRHGTGKSTLLCSLGRALAERFDETYAWQCSPCWRDYVPEAPASWSDTYRSLSPRVLTLVDGFERAPLHQRVRLILAARRRRAPLLLTLHAPCPGVTTLYRTVGELAVCQHLVRERLAGLPNLQTLLITTLNRQWGDYNGDIREALFGMYDAYETHSRQLDP